MDDIDRRNYPELNLLLWDFHNRKIPAHFAFQIYEKRWKFVDLKHMCENECRLINKLNKIYGD